MREENKHFNPESIKVFLHAISLGASIEIASERIGMTSANFYLWQERGKNATDPNDPYFRFLDDYRKARGKRAEKWLEYIDKAMESGAWQAAGWKLARIYPETYSEDSLQLQQIKELVEEIRQLKEAKNGEGKVHSESSKS